MYDIFCSPFWLLECELSDFKRHFRQLLTSRLSPEKLLPPVKLLKSIFLNTIQPHTYHVFTQFFRRLKLFILVIIWKNLLKSMENLWNIYGTSVENLWKIYGTSVENLWKSMENLLKFYVKYMENLLKIYGKSRRHLWKIC